MVGDSEEEAEMIFRNEDNDLMLTMYVLCITMHSWRALWHC